MADPDLQIRGGPGHPDPEKMGGGGRSPKIIFRPFGPQFALKIRGRGPRAPPKVPVLERVHSTPLFIWVKPCFVVSFPACVAGTLKRGGGGGGGGEEKQAKGKWEVQGVFHLHGKTGNSGWKIKWFAPFPSKRFRKHGL